MKQEKKNVTVYDNKSYTTTLIFTKNDIICKTKRKVKNEKKL